MNWVSPEEEYEEEDVVETAAPKEEPVVQKSSTYEQPRNSQPAQNLAANTKMVLFEPRSYSEVEEVGQRLKDGKAVVVNLHKLNTEYSQRTIDFLTGVVFALDGNIQKVGTNVILCNPSEIGVAGSINLNSPAED